MYRIKYKIIEHYLCQDNYSVTRHRGDGYIKGKSIEDVKQKAVEFTIENKYTEQLDHLAFMKLNESYINKYKLEKYKKSFESFNNGELTSEWYEVRFGLIEEIPKSYSFSLKSELKNNSEYQKIISNGEKFLKKEINVGKKRELATAKKIYEKKLLELNNEV